MGIAEEHLTKTERIYKYLENDILNANLKPGTRLIVKNICEKFSVSDSPVREALKLLEATGMIEIVPYIGAVVITPSAEWIGELYIMRAALEGMAAYTSIPYIDEGHLEKINDANKKMKELFQEKNYAQYALLDRKFHSLLYAKTPYKHLLETIESLWKKTEYGRAIFGLEPGTIVESCSEHDVIIEAIIAKDVVKGQRLVQEQKLRVGKQLKTLISKG